MAAETERNLTNQQAAFSHWLEVNISETSTSWVAVWPEVDLICLSPLSSISFSESESRTEPETRN